MRAVVPHVVSRCPVAPRQPVGRPISAACRAVRSAGTRVAVTRDVLFAIDSGG